jgi:hypothetical protein
VAQQLAPSWSRRRLSFLPAGFGRLDFLTPHLCSRRPFQLPSPRAPVGSKNANASKWAGSALSESHEGACPCLASLLQCDSPGNEPPALLIRVSYSITPSPQLTLEPSQKFARDSCSMTPEYCNHARMRLAKSSRRFSTSQQPTIEFLEDIVIRVTPLKINEPRCPGQRWKSI